MQSRLSGKRKADAAALRERQAEHRTMAILKRHGIPPESQM